MKYATLPSYYIRNKFTVAFWIKTEQMMTTGRTCLWNASNAFGNVASKIGWACYIDSANNFTAEAFFRNAANTLENRWSTSGTTISLPNIFSTFYHLAWTQDGSSTNIYVNGTNVFSGNLPLTQNQIATPATPNDSGFIYFTASNHFINHSSYTTDTILDVDIKDFRFFNWTTLSTSEISDIYTSTVQFNTYPPINLPVPYVKVNCDLCGNIMDETGRFAPLTYTGTTQFDSLRNKFVLVSSGSGAGVTLSNFFSPANVTRMFWVRYTTTTPQGSVFTTTNLPIFSQGPDSYNISIQPRDSGSGLPENRLFSTFTPSTTWIHYAFVVSTVSGKTTVTIYRNGVFDNSLISTIIYAAETVTAYIGSYLVTNSLLEPGTRISDITQYNVALTASQVLAIYNAGG